MPQLTQGILISIEGIDGSGKSTLAKNLFAQFNNNSYDTLLTKEPGDTSLGTKIRSLVQTQDIPLCSKTEFLLFAADRAQHFAEIIIPKLAQNTLIISDRLADSSLAYQGYGRNLDTQYISMINNWAMNSIKPHLTLFITIPVEIALERVVKRNEAQTLFEKKEFLEKVAHGFEKLYKNRTDVIIIKGDQPINLVTMHAYSAIESWIHTNNLLR